MSLPAQSFTPEGRWGRLTGSSGWQVGRSPTASEATESPLTGSSEYLKGADVFRKDLLASCWLRCKGCGKAMEGGRR